MWRGSGVLRGCDCRKTAMTVVRLSHDGRTTVIRLLLDCDCAPIRLPYDYRWTVVQQCTVRKFR